jgi:hypothetical protein
MFCCFVNFVRNQLLDTAGALRIQFAPSRRLVADSAATGNLENKALWHNLRASMGQLRVCASFFSVCAFFFTRLMIGAFSPDISCPARNACNLARRLAVGLGIAMTLKADSKSAIRT